MPFLVEDTWINDQATPNAISELEHCALGVDATYWLSLLLDNPPAQEPLLSALGGLTGIESHINDSLEQWEKCHITPLFVFDGQPITGQNEVTLERGIAAHKKTDEAWNLYAQSAATAAVSTFGENPGAFRIQNLYPLLQRILKSRGLHFLVAPYTACAQLAYFEMSDSDQVGGIMGPQDLLMYPINDSVIRSFDWQNNTVFAISKKKVIGNLTPTASESRFIDCFLMTGTSFLPVFPALLDQHMFPRPDVANAANLLRTADNTVANACASFNDMLQNKDPNWLDKYQKARMAVHHFVYIAESGELRVNDYEHLTKDNFEYLGLQLPAELYHYLNTGLISSRLLGYITHGQIWVQPTLDGVVTDQYKQLVAKQTISIREQALGLLIPRLNRAIQYKETKMRVWYDPNFTYTIKHRTLDRSSLTRVASWDVKESDAQAVFPSDYAGPVSREALALFQDDFVEKTFAKEGSIRGIDSTEMVTSVAIWRFLHLRGYTDDKHSPTEWGRALATTFIALQEATSERPNVPGLDEAALLAFELIRLGLLDGKRFEGLAGLPRKGTEEEKSSLLLISRCASLLKMRHEAYGYTGPLDKNLLAFRSLSSTVREADRDLVESIVANMFLYAESKRERDDYLEISQRLPFLSEPDIGLGIAILTFFDEDEFGASAEDRANRFPGFRQDFVPYAEALSDDFAIARDFVCAINKGVQLLSEQLSDSDRAQWARAQEYLDARPFEPKESKE